MMKTIVQMIFEQHATDSLRKTLAEVERAAAGKLHNESLSDYITRLASLKYDAERTNRELDAYREENQRHYAISSENGRVDEEPVEDYMVRVWDSLQVAQRFAEDQKEKLQAANQRIAELLCDPDKAVETLRDLESVANDNGRKEGESVRDFITRVVCELVTAQTQVSMLQKRAIVYGCNAQESVIDFMARTKTEIQSLKNRLSIIGDAADKNGCGRTEETEEFIARIALERKDLAEQVKDLKAGEAESKAAAEEYGVLLDETHSQFIKRVLGDLATAKEEARRERERANRINAEAEENMKKLWKCANDLGRTDYEPLWIFMDRQAAEIGKLRGTHADDIARIDKLSAQLAEIEAEATECGRDDGESVPKFMSRLVIDLGDERASSMAMSKALAYSKEEVASEHKRANRINSEYEADMKKIMATANELGRADCEAPDAFMKRQASEIVGLKKRIDDVIADKTPTEVTKYLYECADKLGRGTTETLSDFMKRQNAELDSQTSRTNEVIAQRDRERQDLQDKAQQLLKVRAWHEEKLQKFRELEGDNARLQSAIKESCEIAAANGRTESESLGWFIDRICAENKRKDQTVARLQKVLTAIHGSAKSSGLKQGEKIGAFIERLNEELYNVRSDAASQSLKMGNANKHLQNAYDEADEERKVSKRFHALAVKERNNAQEEVGKLRKELTLVTKQLQNGQGYLDTYGQLCKFATSCGMTGDESVKQFIERKIIEATTVTADRDRIRAELAAILAEANKSGRCSGDPVALIRQGQVDADAVIYLQRDHARLDALVLQLQAEIDNEKADIAVLERQLDSSAQRVAKTNDEYAALQDRASQAANELSEAQLRAARLSSDLEAILKTANDRGRAIGESVSSFIERLVVNNAELRKARDGYQPVELELRKVQTLMVRIEANTAKAGRADGEDLVDFIWRQQHEKGLAREQSTKEIARLSELVASLQIELDEAKSQYSGIMAQLGNETPLQLIERMQRLSQDQRASTILHDEIAALVGEIADLRKRLEGKTAEHAKLHYDFGSVKTCARNHGLLKNEDLKAFINRKCNELTGALQFGARMQDMANERGAMLDAALKTVDSQSAAISEAQQTTEKYTKVAQAAAKLKEWASTVRHKVLVPMVHTKAMAEYDNIMKDLDGKAGSDANVPQ